MHYMYHRPMYPGTMIPMQIPMGSMPNMEMQDMAEMKEMMKKHMVMTQDIHRMVADMHEKMKKMEAMMKMK